jgi:hypothetical protein
LGAGAKSPSDDPTAFSAPIVASGRTTKIVPTAAKDAARHWSVSRHHHSRLSYRSDTAGSFIQVRSAQFVPRDRLQLISVRAAADLEQLRVAHERFEGALRHIADFAVELESTKENKGTSEFDQLSSLFW